MTSATIAGIGAVTGYGWGFGEFVEGLRSRRAAVTRALVDGELAIASIIPPAETSIPDAERVEAAVRYAVAEAVADAGARGWTAGSTVAVIHCTGIGDIRSMRDLYFRESRTKPSDFPRMLHTSIPSAVAQCHGWTGPSVVLNAACASGNMALTLASDWLAAGRVSDVLVTGAEFSVIAEIVEGFRRMRVLIGADREAAECRPFQEGSRGFFLGEAAIAVVVSSDVPVPRALYLGGAASHDAHHPVAMDPTGTQLERCIREALEDSEVTADDVALLKAHGSGTSLNDRIEGDVADRILGVETRVCSYKPLVGHCMGTSALAELAGLLASWQSGCYPWPVTDDEAHPRLLGAGEAPPHGPVICTSVGLGGANAAVVMAPGDAVAKPKEFL